MCSKARLNDATSYLLERSGDAMGAFKLILEVSRFVIFHKREREREREKGGTFIPFFVDVDSLC